MSPITPSLTNQEKVERLPVIVSTPNGEQLLGVPEIASRTGREICMLLLRANIRIESKCYINE
ncbi:Uncharacterized protein FWK35_00015279 [Aphis craccivora]|uniref:Uncharacterized protein n=1 Tax=Aphis craccivora TaxID=307492 RepID=A0A6G0YCK9_APHCR|nr:Uncharacterized protein FWK35_00015279 [Aphis craccivora]